MRAHIRKNGGKKAEIVHPRKSVFTFHSFYSYTVFTTIDETSNYVCHPGNTQSNTKLQTFW